MLGLLILIMVMVLVILWFRLLFLGVDSCGCWGDNEFNVEAYDEVSYLMIFRCCFYDFVVGLSGVVQWSCDCFVGWDVDVWGYYVWCLDVYGAFDSGCIVGGGFDSSFV